MHPVKRGRWIELPKALNPEENPCKCSECGHVLSFYGLYKPSDFCPNCGAKMIGDSDACNDLYDKLQDEIKELRRLLRLAVDDLGKIASIDECIFPYCDKRCPFYSTDCCEDCCEDKQWQHHDEAWCILNDGSESDA